MKALQIFSSSDIPSKHHVWKAPWSSSQNEGSVQNEHESFHVI